MWNFNHISLIEVVDVFGHSVYICGIDGSNLLKSASPGQRCLLFYLWFWIFQLDLPDPGH